MTSISANVSYRAKSLTSWTNKPSWTMPVFCYFWGSWTIHMSLFGEDSWPVVASVWAKSANATIKRITATPTVARA